MEGITKMVLGGIKNLIYLGIFGGIVYITVWYGQQFGAGLTGIARGVGEFGPQAERLGVGIGKGISGVVVPFQNLIDWLASLAGKAGQCSLNNPRCISGVGGETPGNGEGASIKKLATVTLGGGNVPYRLEQRDSRWYVRTA